AREAQHPARPAGNTSPEEPAEALERLNVAEEPGLGDDHLLDQLLKLLFVSLHPRNIVARPGQPARTHPQPNGVAQGALPQRGRLEADALAQESREGVQT